MENETEETEEEVGGTGVTSEWSSISPTTGMAVHPSELKAFEPVNKWYNSTSNPAELSLTIRGLLVMYNPIVLTIGDLLGVAITETMLLEFVSNASFVIASVMVVYGFARKIYHRFSK